MTRSLILLAFVGLIAAQTHGTWVADTGVQLAGRNAQCGKCYKAPVIAPNENRRKCGSNCYDIDTQRCFVGDQPQAKVDVANGDRICTGLTLDSFCGNSECRTRMINGVETTSFVDSCYLASTHKCINNDLICLKAAQRCNNACMDTTTQQCVLQTDSVATADDMTTDSLAIDKNLFRCGAVGSYSNLQTCYTTPTTPFNDAHKSAGKVICLKTQSVCHNFEKRDLSANQCSGPADRYCFNNDTEICINGDAAVAAGSYADAWICGKDQFRCGYGCINKGDTNSVCIGEDGSVQTADNHHSKGQICTSTTGKSLCGSQCYDPNTQSCWSGSNKQTTNIYSNGNGLKLCGNTVTADLVSDCNCRDVGTCSSELPCVSC